MGLSDPSFASCITPNVDSLIWNKLISYALKFILGASLIAFRLSQHDDKSNLCSCGADGTGGGGVDGEDFCAIKLSSFI